eukprot:2759756-Rhodomonas_salina.2
MPRCRIREHHTEQHNSPRAETAANPARPVCTRAMNTRGGLLYPYCVRVSTTEICWCAESSTRVPVGSMSNKPMKISRASAKPAVSSARRGPATRPDSLVHGQTFASAEHKKPSRTFKDPRITAIGPRCCCAAVYLEEYFVGDRDHHDPWLNWAHHDVPFKRLPVGINEHIARRALLGDKRKVTSVPEDRRPLRPVADVVGSNQFVGQAVRESAESSRNDVVSPEILQTARGFLQVACQVRVACPRVVDTTWKVRRGEGRFRVRFAAFGQEESFHLRARRDLVPDFQFPTVNRLVEGRAI